MPKLKIKEKVNIIITNAFPDTTIPELHIGGRTYRSNFIILNIDTSAKITVSDLFLMICHELCHAVRWQYNDEYASTLLEVLIMEGLATAFEIEAAVDNALDLDFFAETIKNTSLKESERIFVVLKPELNNTSCDWGTILYNGDEKKELPRWVGYIVGYYLVSRYLKKTNKKPSEAFADKYEKIKT